MSLNPIVVILLPRRRRDISSFANLSNHQSEKGEGHSFISQLSDIYTMNFFCPIDGINFLSRAEASCNQFLQRLLALTRNERGFVVYVNCYLVTDLDRAGVWK